MFKSYIIQIINSVLMDYNVSVNHLDIQFNDSVIWIIYSYTHSINNMEEESKLRKKYVYVINYHLKMIIHINMKMFPLHVYMMK